MKVRDVSIRNYDDADKYLGDKDHRPLCHNTYMWREGGVIHVRYHRTDIVTYLPHYVVVTVCGWETSTTKERVNNLIPTRFRIFQEKHVWKVWDRLNDTHFNFHDGMVIDTL